MNKQKKRKKAAPQPKTIEQIFKEKAMEMSKCEDCGHLSNDLITKNDHHGGTKTVCKDRNACHNRGG